MPADRLAEYRAQIAKSLDWQEAHARFEAAVEGISGALRGATPAGLAHSPWQLLEHIRLTQHDILDFCRNPSYEEPTWPDDYWPRSAAPPSERAWQESIEGYRTDRDALQRLAVDPQLDLLATIPHGTGQTYLREVLLVLDHTAYHVGQIVDVRRALGAWP